MPPLSENVARLNIPEVSTPSHEQKYVQQKPFFHEKKGAEPNDSAKLYRVSAPLSENEADDEHTEENSDVSLPRLFSTLNTGPKLFTPITRNTSPVLPLRVNHLPLKEQTTEYASLLEKYNELCDKHAVVILDLERTSASIQEITANSIANSNQLADTYDAALKLQSQEFQAQNRLLKQELAVARRAHNELQQDHETLLQWVKAMFTELDRVAKKSHLNLDTNTESVMKLVKHPYRNNAKLTMIYRKFATSYPK